MMRLLYNCNEEHFTGIVISRISFTLLLRWRQWRRWGQRGSGREGEEENRWDRNRNPGERIWRGGVRLRVERTNERVVYIALRHKAGSMFWSESPISAAAGGALLGLARSKHSSLSSRQDDLAVTNKINTTPQWSQCCTMVFIFPRTQMESVYQHSTFTSLAIHLYWSESPHHVKPLTIELEIDPV